MMEPYAPNDFLQFWERVVWSAREDPLEIRREHRSQDDVAGHVTYRLSFAGASHRVYGWYAVPDEQSSGLAGMLWLPPYGLNATPINKQTSLPGHATFSLNLLGHEPDYAVQYDQRTGEGGYMARGLENRDSYIFREFVIDALRGLEALSQQPEVDSNRLIAAGMSQGGGLAIWLAALTTRLRAVSAEMPFFADHREYLGRAYPRYPYKEIYDFAVSVPASEEDVRHTLAYFDTLNFAPYARVPVQLSYGTKDPAVKPEGVQAVYAALPEPKNLIVYQRGHEWVDDMPTNRLAWVKRFE